MKKDIDLARSLRITKPLVIRGEPLMFLEDVNTMLGAIYNKNSRNVNRKDNTVAYIPKNSPKKVYISLGWVGNMNRYSD